MIWANSALKFFLTRDVVNPVVDYPNWQSHVDRVHDGVLYYDTTYHHINVLPFVMAYIAHGYIIGTITGTISGAPSDIISGITIEIISNTISATIYCDAISGTICL